MKIMLFKECSIGNKVFIGYELLKREMVYFLSLKYHSCSSLLPHLLQINFSF